MTLLSLNVLILLQDHGQKSPLMAAIDNNNERGVAIMLDNFKDFARMPVFDQDKSLIQDSGLFLPENELVCCRYWRFMYPAENRTNESMRL